MDCNIIDLFTILTFFTIQHLTFHQKLRYINQTEKCDSLSTNNHQGQIKATHMVKLSAWDLGITMIHMLKDLVEMLDNIHERTGNSVERLKL